MVEFVTALGLVFVIEGVLYAFIPERMRRVMRVTEQVPADKLRVAGALGVALGVGIVWLARSVLA